MRLPFTNDPSRPRRRRLVLGALAAAGLVAAFGAGSWAAARAQAPTPAPDEAPAPAGTADHAGASGAEADRPRPGEVRRLAPAYVPRVDTGLVDRAGAPVLVSCGTCHATRPPDPGRCATDDAMAMHRGLVFAHGERSCLACHDPGDYDRLRLAHGEPVPFAEAPRLCAQCHGPQQRDWERGLHGGMNGFWDAARGGRERHACTSCHDPHAPAYPLVTPVFHPPDPLAGRGRPIPARGAEGGAHGH